MVGVILWGFGQPFCVYKLEQVHLSVIKTVMTRRHRKEHQSSSTCPTEPGSTLVKTKRAKTHRSLLEIAHLEMEEV